MKKLFTPASPHLTIPPGTNQKWHRFGAIFLLFFSLTTVAEAQSKIWDKTIGSNNSESLNAAILTKDDGSLLAGIISIEDVYSVTTKEEIVKLNADGNKVWSKIIDDPNFKITAIQEIAEGGYLLGGYSYTKNGDYQVIKIKQDGTQVWVKTYGRKYMDYLSVIQQTHDGSFILGGYSQTGNGSDGGPINDYWVVKLDGSGNKVWDKSFGGTGDDILESIQQTNDGGYIVGGYSYSGVSGNKSEPNKGKPDEFGRPTHDYWVIKLKADGTQAWDKTLGGGGDDYLRTLKQTGDGSFLLGGLSSSGISGDKTAAEKGSWVIKLNTNGNKVWDKAFDGSISSLEPTKDGSYLLGLSSSSNIGGAKSEASRGDTDYWILKLRADGTKLWDKTIGGQGSDILNAAYPTKDGNYLLAGTSGSDISFEKSEKNIKDKYYSSAKNNDYWLVKLDNTIRQNQSLTFPTLKMQPYTKEPLTLAAQAGSGLPVTYRVISGPATVKGNKLTLTGAGEVVVKALQTGNATYNAVEAAQSLVVTLASKQQDQSFGGSQSEILTTLLATPDGGYLAGGMSASDATGTKSQAGQGKYDYWVVKTDNTGKKVWDKSFGGNLSDQLTTLVATSDGGYLLGGTSASGISTDKSQASKGKEDYWLVKIDAKGTKQWDKSYGGSEKDSLASIIATPKGYLLGGTSASGITGDKSQTGKGAADYWIMEIDVNGNKLWDKTYGGSGKDHLAALLTTPDGYLVGGSSASGISGDKSQAPRGTKDYWVLCIRKDGTKIWEKTYGGLINYSYSFGGGQSLLQDLVATPDGGFLLAGTSNASKGGERSEGRRGEEGETLELHVNPDYWVVKINGQGTKLWDNFYGAEESFYDPYRGSSFLNKVVALPEGSYLLGGSTDGYGGDISEDTQGRYDYWLVKIDEQGKKIGDKTMAGAGGDQLTALVIAQDGSYLLGGTSDSDIGLDKSTNSEGGTNYWIVKVKANADTLPDEPLTIAWDMRYGGASRDNFTTQIKTTDGGYLSGGYTFSGKSGDKSQRGQGKNDYWMVKSDKNGKKFWDKRFGGSDNDYLNEIIQTADGGYLLAGSTYSGVSGDKSQASRGDRDYWVVKTDAQGNKQWDKRFGGSGNDELKKVLQLASGEYVLAGYSNSPISGDKSQSTQGTQGQKKNDYWIVKITATGSKIWDKRYGGYANDELASITLTATGGFILGGTSFSGAGADKTQAGWGYKDFWLVRIDAQGNKIWDKRYGSIGDDILTTVGMNRVNSPQTDADGDYYVGGYTESRYVGGDRKQEGRDGFDYWFLQIKSNGNLIRENSYGGNQDDILQSVVQTEEGDYLLAGTSYSGASGDKTHTGLQGEGDYWVMRINAIGTKKSDFTFGGNGKEELRSVVLAEDGGYVLGGRSDSGVSGDRSQPSQGGTDYWLIKIAPESSPTVAARVATQPASVNPVNEVQVQAYPNPFQDKLTIRFTLPETQAATLKVLDSQGREVNTLFQGEAQANQMYQVEWQAGKHASGMYLLQLQTPTQQNIQKVLLSK